MMSIKGGMEGEGEGTESHPILRAHNYKKPQLEKINHPTGANQGGNNNGITFNMQEVD